MNGPQPVPDITCAELVRTFDWSRTELGPYERWPERLKGYVAMVLEMPTPAIIFWGPDHVQLYNDAYSVIMGPRHPRYFGATYRECWPDTYPVIYPWMQRVLRGEVFEVERTLFALTRYGFTEEAYFTFTFSPLRDDTGAIAGILQPVVEVTQEVIGARRTQTLRDVPPYTPGCDAALDVAHALTMNPEDVPFATFYTFDERGSLRCAATCGLAPHDEQRFHVAPACLRDVLASGEAAVVDASRVLDAREHVGVWNDPTRNAYVVPVRGASSDDARGVAVFGISPRLRFDERYRDFFDAVARELAAHLDAERARRAELDLQLSAEAARSEADAERTRLHSIFENAPIAIAILTGPDFVMETANPYTCAIWGRSREQLVGRRVFDAIPELAGRGFEELLAQVRSTGKPYLGTEVKLPVPRDPPEDAYFNFVYEPMRDASGEITSIIVVATDVTVHVRARQAAESLAAELEKARREAEEARDVAQRANRAKDEFMAMLGHELRNPLAPIFTALELMNMRGDDSHSRERAVIERQARHLSVLVEDLLDISRITSGKVELKRSHVELAPIIAKAVETASPLFEKRRHDLHIDVPVGLVVDGDPARLSQVFANLLTNAAKYTESGGRIEIAAAAGAGEIRVTVSDTGRGISREMLPRVFDLFVQEKQNLDRSLGGLGLGLAIVKNLVAMHGGSVEARSRGPGQGSTFVVHLPALSPVATNALAGVRSAGQATVAPRGERILVVDDNEDAATMLAEMLGALGFACSIAHDGPRAIELARQATFDTVLLDIGLPAMDGYEVARHLRELETGRRLRLVAITGYGQYDDRQRSMEAGFDHHLVKPIDLRALTGVLREAAHDSVGPRSRTTVVPGPDSVEGGTSVRVDGGASVRDDGGTSVRSSRSR